ncbi:hypothetical protein RCO48_21360 [Peribacillus frigoritolerans]|nr:hypothetical protein [Peribacillus frigoritolerans]
MQKVYPELHHLTKKNPCGCWRKEVGCPVSEEEVAYFTIYFGGWLRRQGTTLDDRKTGDCRMPEWCRHQQYPHLYIEGIIS